MSASLIVLIPLMLVGLVAALCFVGCGFPTGGLPFDPGPYETAIKQTKGVLAYWPLNDQQIGKILPVNAADVAPKPMGVNPFNGTYSGTLGTSFKLGQASIVVGDTSSSPDCVLFNGVDGFVSVPFHPELNQAQPPIGFTVEAWVLPGWTADDPGNRVVVASDDPSASQGYSILATPDNSWAAAIGTGSAPIVIAQPPLGSHTIDFINPTYLCMTYDGTTLQLFVNPTSNSPLMAMGSGFAPVPSPTPFVIGVGNPNQPAFFFKGKIQDVAFYSTVLDFPTIMTHFNLGNTPPPSDGT